MSTRNWTRGGVGFVAAIMATISVTACDPYLAANKDAPVVLGVTMVDLNYNTDFNGVLPGDSPGCTAPFPQPDQAWADRVFPGLCVAGGPTTVCPVLCYPPRTGPGYAPFFTGNLGGSYQTAGGTALHVRGGDLVHAERRSAHLHRRGRDRVHLRPDPGPLQQAHGPGDHPARPERLRAALDAEDLRGNGYGGDRRDGRLRLRVRAELRHDLLGSEHRHHAALDRLPSAKTPRTAWSGW